jgi:hypothetical protein
VQQLWEIALNKPWGLVRSEQQRLQFFRLARHCRRQQQRGKCKEAGSLFAWCLKKRSWQGSIEDEDEARKAIARLDGLSRSRVQPPGPSAAEPPRDVGQSDRRSILQEYSDRRRAAAEAELELIGNP